MGKPLYLVEVAAKVWPMLLRNGRFGESWYHGRTRIPCVHTNVYRQTVKARSEEATSNLLYAGVVLFDAAGAVIGSAGSWGWVAAGGVAAGTGWATYTATFGAGQAITLPSNAAFMAPVLVLASGWSFSSQGRVQCREQWLELTSAAGVALGPDRYMRDRREWSLYSGVDGEWLHLHNDGVQDLTLRYSTAAYCTAAADTPARTHYSPRVLQPGLVRSEIPAGGTGPIASGFGEIVLANSDGELSLVPYYGLDGQQVSVLYGQDDAPRSTFVELLRASCDQAVADRRQLRLRLRSPDTLLKRRACANTYAGTNALPAGLEGVAEDLAGQPKPRLYGSVRNIAPPCVNTTRLIYQVHDAYAPRPPDNLNEYSTVSAVYVRGLALTQGSDYTSQSDMETTAPSAGQYRVWPEGGYFRLGATPGGQVTCDAARVDGASGPDASYGGWAYYVRQLAADMGVSPLRATVTGYVGDGEWPGNWLLSATTPWGPVAGVWVNDTRAAADVMTDLARAAGAFFGFCHWDGIPGDAFEFGHRVYPPNVENATLMNSAPRFDESSVLGVQAIADPGEGRGVPFWRVDLGYWPNNSVQSADLDSSMSVAEKSEFSALGKRVQASDVTVKDKNPTAREFVRETGLVDGAAATDEAERLLHQLMLPKLWFELRVSLGAVLAQAVRPSLGGFVWLTWLQLRVLTSDGAGVGLGQFLVAEESLFIVQAIELDFATKIVRMTVRQATEATRT